MLPEFLNQSGYADHRGVSRKTVTGWKQRGLLDFAEDGRVNVASSDRRLAEHGVLLPKVTTSSDATLGNDEATSLEAAAEELVSAPGGAKWSKAEAERIKENYAALLRQLEFERESGAVVEIEDVIVAVASEYAVVRNRLLGIGSKVAPSAAVLKSAEEIKAIIDEEVIAALNELAIDDGQRDFGDLRKSLQHRFGPSADEVAPSP